MRQEIGAVQWRQALAARHGEARQQRLEAATVAICGLGGLGSCVALALARAGVGRLLLLDFDRVELSNLHRQQYKASQIGQYKTEALRQNLLEIAPFVQAVPRTVRLGPDNLAELLAEAQVICEALDKAEAKAMLCDGVLSQLPESYLVAASGMAGWGPANSIRTRRITERFYICGDGRSDVETAGTLTAARVMVCAAHQAQAVLQILTGQMEV